jgi:hypothetical protein
LRRLPAAAKQVNPKYRKGSMIKLVFSSSYNIGDDDSVKKDTADKKAIYPVKIPWGIIFLCLTKA